MKILHCADIHLGDLAGPMKDGKNARRLDTLECMRHVVTTVKDEHPNIVVVAGDLFNRSRVWADTALEDVNDAITEFIRPLCRHSEQVVILFGTENHDNPRSFDVLEQTTRNESNLHILTRPDVYLIETSEGPIQILAVPGFDKGRLRLFCPGADKETENRNATALINDVVMGLSTKIDHDIPSMLVAHYTVAGSESDNGSTFLAGQDVVILPSVIDSTGVDLACLGHIHRPQRLSCHTPSFYSGSVNQLTFNDEGTFHGFYVHDMDDITREITSRFIRTPERRHYTLRLSPDEIANFLTTGEIPVLPSELNESIVRIRYNCPAEHDKAINKAELQKKIQSVGAFHIAEILPEDVDDSAGAEDINEHEGPVEALNRYLGKLNLNPDNINRLNELAAPLIKTADDGRDADKRIGNFTPIRIEVTNYRSYTQAEFCLDDIHMAMVNGQNGVGKSSLFMDAIADCLYEQSRNEDIGGWVRDGTKSGAITFEFAMGADRYRVIRTRTKSGKGSLSVHRWSETNEWADVGDSTMRLTQEHIERILGMDCNTFCSIALIRQDAYGLFLEADSNRRMEVLSALLDLNVYGKLEGLSKDCAAEQRRQIAASRERLDILNEQISAKDNLSAEDAELAEKESEKAATITALDSAVEAAQREDAMRTEIEKQASEKDAEAASLAKDAANKQMVLESTRKRMDDATKLADEEADVEKAANEVSAARETLSSLSTKEEEYRSTLQHEQNIRKALNTYQENKARLLKDKSDLVSTLERKDEIMEAQRQLEALRKDKENDDSRVNQYLQASKKRDEAKTNKDAYLAECRVSIENLSTRENETSKKADLLNNSGCPIPETASCAFLSDAIKAKAELEDIRKSLQDTKNTSRTEYERLLKIYTDYNAECDALADGHIEEVTRISEREKAISPTASLSITLAEAEAKCKAIDDQIKSIDASIQEHEEQIADITARLPELEKIHMEAERARETIVNQEQSAARLSQCRAASATVSALKLQIAELEKDITSLNTKSNLASIAAADLRSRLPETKSNLSELLEQRSAHISAQNEISSKRGGIKTRLDGIAESEKQAAQYRTIITEIGRTLNDYQTLVQAFGLDGIQNMIIRGVVPEIMHRSNDILAAMTGGKMAVDIRTEKEQKSNQKIVNSLEVWITSITGGSRPYLSHSGGEKVKIALAVTLGLSDVKARRAGVQLGMLFIDEPPFLDADGTDAYADALSNMAARNPSMRILAISHDPTMKARFTQNITVHGSEDGSIVTVD